MNRNVAIVGHQKRTAASAPFDDEAWDIWGVNEIGMFVPGRYTAHYNIHKAAELRAEYPERIAWLAKQEGKVWLGEPMPEVPNGEQFPFQSILEAFHEPMRYHRSGISWMFAHALLQGYTTIGIYGVDMSASSEYHYQRPNMECWIGYAIATGVDVVLPADCPLIQGHFLYGLEDPPKSEGAVTEKVLKSKRIRQMQIADQARDAHSQADALVREYAWIVENFDSLTKEKAMERLSKASMESERFMRAAAEADGALRELGFMLGVIEQYKRDNPHLVYEDPD